MNTLLKGPSSVWKAESPWMSGGTTGVDCGDSVGEGVSEGDGCGGAARGGCGAVGGIFSPPKRGDMSARHGSWGSVGQGLEAGLPDSGSAWTPGHGVGDGGPVSPIRLAANCGQGGVHEIEALGRSGHSGPRSYGIGVIAGYKGRVAVNISRKGRFRPKKRPSMQDRSSPQGVVTLLPVSHPGCSARTVALASLGT